MMTHRSQLSVGGWVGQGLSQACETGMASQGGGLVDRDSTMEFESRDQLALVGPACRQTLCCLWPGLELSRVISTQRGNIIPGHMVWGQPCSGAQ